MKIELKRVKDLKVGDVIVLRKDTNTKYSSNITLVPIVCVSKEIIVHDNKFLSAFMNKIIPPTMLPLYNINDAYFGEDELLEVVDEI
jgi:hypothetical protein